LETYGPRRGLGLMEDATYLYYHMANWFAENPPGTPVPEWCFLSWPIREEDVEELVKLYEKDTGRKIYERWE